MHHMTITQTAFTPVFAEEDFDYQAKFQELMNDFNNLVRRNMMNVRPQYKKNKCPGIYDRDYDSYCSLVSYSEFVNNIGYYVDLAFQKRAQLDRYEIHKRL